MDLAGAFLELWLRMASLKLWLGIEGQHVVFLELWFRMTDGTGVSVQVVTRMKSLHSI